MTCGSRTARILTKVVDSTCWGIFMKKIVFMSSMTLVLIFGMFLSRTQALSGILDDRGLERIEVPVEVALSPVKGFDDNDNIQVVLYGKLPNACYGLDEYQVEKVSGEENFYRIRQFAIKRTDGICA